MGAIITNLIGSFAKLRIVVHCLCKNENRVHHPENSSDSHQIGLKTSLAGNRRWPALTTGQCSQKGTAVVMGRETERIGLLRLEGPNHAEAFGALRIYVTSGTLSCLTLLRL